MDADTFYDIVFPQKPSKFPHSRSKSVLHHPCCPSDAHRPPKKSKIVFQPSASARQPMKLTISRPPLGSITNIKHYRKPQTAPISRASKTGKESLPGSPVFSRYSPRLSTPSPPSMPPPPSPKQKKHWVRRLKRDKKSNTRKERETSNISSRLAQRNSQSKDSESISAISAVNVSILNPMPRPEGGDKGWKCWCFPGQGKHVTFDEHPTPYPPKSLSTPESEEQQTNLEPAGHLSQPRGLLSGENMPIFQQPTSGDSCFGVSNSGLGDNYGSLAATWPGN